MVTCTASPTVFRDFVQVSQVLSTCSKGSHHSQLLLTLQWQDLVWTWGSLTFNKTITFIIRQSPKKFFSVFCYMTVTSSYELSYTFLTTDLLSLSLFGFIAASRSFELLLSMFVTLTTFVCERANISGHKVLKNTFVYICHTQTSLVCYVLVICRLKLLKTLSINFSSSSNCEDVAEFQKESKQLHRWIHQSLVHHFKMDRMKVVDRTASSASPSHHQLSSL